MKGFWAPAAAQNYSKLDTVQVFIFHHTNRAEAMHSAAPCDHHGTHSRKRVQ